MDFTGIDALKARLDSFRPLSDAMVRNLREELVLQWTYNSNAIEGNTLTLKETKVALEGITVGGKTLREHFEVINHRDAILYVEELVKTGAPLREWDIRAIHQLILRNIDNASAGTYRRINVVISGAEHRPPDYLTLNDEMAALIQWYQTEGMALHPVERSAKVHVDFVKIHPFVDGNGRTARLLMNLELMKAGFPAAVLPVKRRLAYYEALDLAHVEGNYEPFLRLIAEVVAESFAVYWFALGVASDET